MLMLNQVVAGTEETMVPQAEEIPPTAHAGHVLLVEDDDGMRMLISRALRESGYRVTGCRNGAEMWRFLPEGGVDLVLLDVMLPGASGLDLLRALRSKGTLPVIMLSARAEEADRVLGLELGPTTMSPSRSGDPSCWPAFEPFCAALRLRLPRPRRRDPRRWPSPAGGSICAAAS